MAWNLVESGVHPLRLEELVDSEGDRQARCCRSRSSIPQTNGTLELRASIAAMYPGAAPAHVQVTNGGSEANSSRLMHLVEPGDEVVVLVPNYMQTRGLAPGAAAPTSASGALQRGARHDQARWRADLDALDALVTRTHAGRS